MAHTMRGAAQQPAHRLPIAASAKARRRCARTGAWRQPAHPRVRRARPRRSAHGLRARGRGGASSGCPFAVAWLTPVRSSAVFSKRNCQAAFQALACAQSAPCGRFGPHGLPRVWRCACTRTVGAGPARRRRVKRAARRRAPAARFPCRPSSPIACRARRGVPSALWPGAVKLHIMVNDSLIEGERSPP